MAALRRRNLLMSTLVVFLAILGLSLSFQQPLSTNRIASTQQLYLHQCSPANKHSSCVDRRGMSPLIPSFTRNHVVLDLASRSGIPDNNEDRKDINEDPRSTKKVNRRRRWRKFTTGLAAFVLTAFAPLKYTVKSASASAPVMAIPKAEGRDPATEAMLAMERKKAQQAQKELNDMAREARRIEAEQGEAARVKYEQDYKTNKKQQAEEKAAGLVALKRELLEQGICPFVDMDGQRQVIAYRSGVDLANTAGTPFYMEKVLEKRNSPKAYSNRKAANRQVIACMVQDMKNRGIDPLEYFGKHQDQTQSILELSKEKASQLVIQYTANLEAYGQITVPKPGEMSAKEKIEAARDPKAEAKRLKEEKRIEAQRLKEEKRIEAQRLKEEKRAKAAEAKAAQKAERARKKEEARLEKENAKKGSKATTFGAASSAALALGTSAMKDSANNIAGSLDSAVNTFSDVPGKSHAPSKVVDDSTSAFDTSSSSVSEKRKPLSSKSTSIADKIITPKAIGGIVVVGGGAFAFKMFRDKAAADERERQRQFELLMGNTEINYRSDDESQDFDYDEEESDDIDGSAFASTAPEVVTPPPTKKRRLGISLFNKKSNRETDINKLVAPSSPNPEFASALAKLLSFGAPGRFPAVAALPGSMPLGEFDLSEATVNLLELKGDLSEADTVELFAAVVNCMLIEILDLASSALSLKKEKDEATVEALNIVVDFMNHAAELFGSVAGQDVLMDPPVRYEGSLSKSKLEQMYGIYAAAGSSDISKLLLSEGEGETPSSNMREDHEQRVAMLQDVFGISDKKAQGITMKAAQKTMMEMAKSGKMNEMIEKMGGAEGMQEMMKGMGGLDGMDPAMMEAMADPEKLLPELKRIQSMVEAGTFPESELKDIQSQFKDAFGSDDIEKALLEGRDFEELTDTEKQFLEAMKVIMKA